MNDKFDKDGNLLPGVNTGVIIAPPKPTDWIVSGETGITPIVLEQGAQWDAYLPDEESQGSYVPITFDGENCISYGATNDIEILIQRLRALGQMPATHETFLVNNGYVDRATSKVNFSDRFTGKMSGTTINGNSLGAVADSVRSLHGLLPESDWARPTFSAGMSQADAWALYYAEVPQALQAKAKTFLDYFAINYQWFVLGAGTVTASQIKEQLKYGPLQIASQVCPGWSINPGVNIIQACGCTPGHATTLYGYDDGGNFKDFDSYKGFRKLLASNYCIPYALQFTCVPKDPSASSAPFHYVFNINLTFGMGATPEVHNLQSALQALKDPTGKPYMAAGVFGAYGPATKAALAHLQAVNSIVDDGSNFGPKTRAAVNKLLNGA